MYVYRVASGRSLYSPQRFQLRFAVQAVTGLHLGCEGPVLEHPVQVPLDGVLQLFFAASARRRYRREDASAGRV